MAIQFQVKGYKALAILAAFLAFAIFRQVMMSRTLDTEAVAALKPMLTARYLAPALEDLQSRPYEKMSRKEKEAFSKRLLARQRPEIKAISARGWGERVVVRVEVECEGGSGTEDQDVRYFRMRYSTLLGWTYQQEVGSWAYYLAL